MFITKHALTKVELKPFYSGVLTSKSSTQPHIYTGHQVISSVVPDRCRCREFPRWQQQRMGHIHQCPTSDQGFWMRKDFPWFKATIFVFSPKRICALFLCIWMLTYFMTCCFFSYAHIMYESQCSMNIRVFACVLEGWLASCYPSWFRSINWFGRFGLTIRSNYNKTSNKWPCEMIHSFCLHMQIYCTGDLVPTRILGMTIWTLMSYKICQVIRLCYWM